MKDCPWKLVCLETGAAYAGDVVRYRSDTGAELDVVHDLSGAGPGMLERFDARRASREAWDRSGVWRFRELILPAPEDQLVARGEGNTTLYDAPGVASYVGLDQLQLKHEGENPTGSFKDRGMTVGVTIARMLGMSSVACASTGNTSASMASYAAIAGMRPYVFMPEGAVSFGKLSQSLAYGARTIQIRGNFDDAMRLVEQVCVEKGVYLLNSLNPFRLEGQKAIGFEILQDLGWIVPDWIVLPGGNLGNNSAIFKGLLELQSLGLIDRLPRLAIVQAAGADPLYRAFCAGHVEAGTRPEARPDVETLATAIRIGDPVSWRRTYRALQAGRGIVEHASDDAIMDAKAVVDAAGIGAEPASCGTVAGLRSLVAAKVIKPDEHVVGVLTGHVLKDPGVIASYHAGELEGINSARANAPIVCDATMDDVLRAMDAGQ